MPPLPLSSRRLWERREETNSSSKMTTPLSCRSVLCTSWKCTWVTFCVLNSSGGLRYCQLSENSQYHPFGRVIGWSIELLVRESSYRCCCGRSLSKKLYNLDAEIEDVSVLFKCWFVRTGYLCGELPAFRRLSWKNLRVVRKGNNTVFEWEKSHLRYLQIFPPSGKNPSCGVGFTLASKWGKSDQRSCEASTLRGENPVVDFRLRVCGNPIAECHGYWKESLC